MQQATGTLIGKRGVRLRYGQWYPNGDPKAVVALAHGYGEHIGRYEHVIAAMVERGYALFAIDHRGHGQSEGERALVEKFDFYVEDLHLMMREARGAHTDLPLILIGHSMGGLIATRYALRYPDAVEALVLSGAALQVGDDVSPLLKRVSGVLAQVIPSVPLIPAGENVLSRDPEVERRFQEDPLTYTGRVKVRMAHEMMTASIDARARCDLLDMPLLVMHGTADRLTNPVGSERLYAQACSTDKTLKLWPDNYHEIFNDLDQAEVIAFMLDWIDERVARLKGA